MKFDKKRVKEFLHLTIYLRLRTVYLWLQPIYHKIEAKRKLQLYRTQGFYFFKLKYFGKWELVKLNRYFDWQLWEEGNPVSSAMEASIDEYKALQSTLVNTFPEGPKVVMDFGCGIGRSSVFFKHMLKWRSTKFILVDSHEDVFGTFANRVPSQTSFHCDISSLEGSFYTNFDLIDRFLLSNDIYIYDLVDLRKDRYKLSVVKDVDLFYSFNSIGYHYDILGAFDYYGIHDCLQPGALLIFGIRRKHDPLLNELTIDNFIQRGYKKLKVIEGYLNQDFLVMQKT